MTSSTEIDLSVVRDAVGRFEPFRESDLIPLLQELQDAYGYLPGAALEAVATEVDIPLSRVTGVATFYEQFSLTPRGKHLVRACRGTACHVRGGAQIASAIERHLGVSEGETTPDGLFTFHTVACLGLCFLSPSMVVDKNFYGKLTPDKVGPILAQYAKTKSVEGPRS